MEVSSQSTEKELFVLVKRKILIQESYYLLSGLFVELQQLYDMYCANENIRGNKKMKCFLQENVKVCFTLVRGIHENPIVVNVHEVNQPLYSSLEPGCVTKRSRFLLKDDLS